jgi:PAS domain S-box-containing protein
LLQANAQLEALLDNTTAMISLIDARGRFLRINRRWEVLFGLSNQTTTGRSLSEFLSRETSDLLLANNERVFEAGRPMEFEEKVAVYGKPRTFLSVKVPLYEPTGARYAICGISTDITERNDAERRERELLRQASARKERFIVALAHELRSPLSAITAAVHTLEKCTREGAAIDASAIISRQTTHIARLVDQLLEASRVASGRVRIRKDRVDLGAALDQAIEAVRPTLEKRGQRLHVLVPEPVAVDGDATRLTQVFVNLLANASRYSQDQMPITVAVTQTGGDAVIVVRDKGRGIAPDALPKVFDLLFQAEGEANEKGLGLGLAIVRGIVEAHGGCVTARSEGRGQGSEFTVTIPAAASVP